MTDHQLQWTIVKSWTWRNISCFSNCTIPYNLARCTFCYHLRLLRSNRILLLVHAHHIPQCHKSCYLFVRWDKNNLSCHYMFLNWCVCAAYACLQSQMLTIAPSNPSQILIPLRNTSTFALRCTPPPSLNLHRQHSHKIPICKTSHVLRRLAKPAWPITSRRRSIKCISAEFVGAHVVTAATASCGFAVFGHPGGVAAKIL